MSIVCLLPARNAASELAGYLESVVPLCDAVVALDDGSTDDTRAMLAASDLVRVLLTRPRRDTYAGWDDGENRNRLLSAAADLDPRWIVCLDADERIDLEDALALRRFLQRDAVEGCAYGLQHFRVWGEDGVDPRFTWIYRVFAFAPGQRFPDRRLHFNPVPTAIPRAAWLGTTIRVRHRGAMDAQRLAARGAKYAQADPSGAFGVDAAGLDGAPPGPVQEWQVRASGLPVLAAAPPARPKLVCLLPVRNAEHDLPGYLDCVSGFADTVVALDDGSTDGTRALLEADPRVSIVLDNPVRGDYRGWDDAGNRNRLLEAAAELDPEWVLSLDADERVDRDDATALRAFVDHDALAGFAYGFCVHRMLEPGTAYDKSDLWAYRLFAHAPGQRFPDARMHPVPIPTAIPRERWLKTTVRIQHLASMTEEHRRRRFAKYLEADPDCEFQAGGYAHLLDPPGEAQSWKRRAASEPVLAPSGSDLDLEAPLLSAIVISRNDQARIERSVRSVVEQRCDAPFEVIVVTSGVDRTAAIVRERFPEVTLVELDHPALPGEARNAGLRVARGDYVSFPGSHVELPSGSLAARIAAHERGYAMVTGTTLNGTDTRAGWASYFLDHSTVLPGRPTCTLSGPPAHCSYIRDHLLEVGGFPEDMRTGEDTVVNRELARRGYPAVRAAEVTLVHASPCCTIARLVRHHAQRGRGLARIRLDDAHASGHGLLTRAFLKSMLVHYVPRRVDVISGNVARWGDDWLRARYRRVYPLVLAGATAAWVGAWCEFLRPAPGKPALLFGRRRRLGEGRTNSLKRPKRERIA